MARGRHVAKRERVRLQLAIRIHGLMVMWSYRNYRKRVSK